MTCSESIESISDSEETIKYNAPPESPYTKILSKCKSLSYDQISRLTRDLGRMIGYSPKPLPQQRTPRPDMEEIMDIMPQEIIEEKPIAKPVEIVEDNYDCSDFDDYLGVGGSSENNGSTPTECSYNIVNPSSDLIVTPEGSEQSIEEWHQPELSELGIIQATPVVKLPMYKPIPPPPPNQRNLAKKEPSNNTTNSQIPPAIQQPLIPGVDVCSRDLGYDFDFVSPQEMSSSYEFLSISSNSLKKQAELLGDNQDDTPIKQLAPCHEIRTNLPISMPKPESATPLAVAIKEQRRYDPVETTQPNTQPYLSDPFTASSVEQFQKFFSEKFAWSERLQKIMVKLYGESASFRFNQEHAINALLCNRDVIAIMPTGAGKSTIYAVPALCYKVCLVISPLLSLIKDQVRTFTKHNINAVEVTSYDSLKTLSSGVWRPIPTVLFITPEKVTNHTYSSMIAELVKMERINAIIIDECHCMLSWGFDFRKCYSDLQLSKLRGSTNIPIVALTATTNFRGAREISRLADMRNPVFFSSPLNRPNIAYEFIYKERKERNETVLNIIKTQFSGKTGIVYCLSRKDCEETSQFLNSKGVRSKYFHAELSPSIRAGIQDSWQDESIKVICATIAFGMGVDKSNVRYVIHTTAPKTLESFYQESGRAGRDGRPCKSIVLWSLEDHSRIDRLIRGSKMSYHDSPSRVAYHECFLALSSIKTCRRTLILKSFDQEHECGPGDQPCDCCARLVTQSIDITKNAQNLINNLSKGITWTMAVRFLSKEKVNGRPPLSIQESIHVVCFLLVNKIIVEDNRMSLQNNGTLPQITIYRDIDMEL